MSMYELLHTSFFFSSNVQAQLTTGNVQVEGEIIKKSAHGDLASSVCFRNLQTLGEKFAL